MKAELALGGWLVTYRKTKIDIQHLNTVAHLSTNQARCRLTSLIEAKR